MRSQIGSRNSTNTKIEVKQPTTSQRSSKGQINPIGQSEKQSTTTNTSSNNFKLPPASNQNIKPVLMQNAAGDGLWCQVKDDRYQLQAERFVEKKAKQAESKIESELIDTLEKQCTEIGKELEVERIKLKNKNIEIMSMKKIIDQQSVVKYLLQSNSFYFI